jgi:V8-like Glu-specific endopeptidase
MAWWSGASANYPLSKGSSGSPLLNKYKEICGIYWGGWINQNDTQFQPNFSIFNTSTKNYLANFI